MTFITSCLRRITKFKSQSNIWNEEKGKTTEHVDIIFKIEMECAHFKEIEKKNH